MLNKLSLHQSRDKQNNLNKHQLSKRSKVREDITITETDLTELKEITEETTTEEKVKERDVSTNQNTSKREVNKDKKKAQALNPKKKLVNSEESKLKSSKTMASQ